MEYSISSAHIVVRLHNDLSIDGKWTENWQQRRTHPADAIFSDVHSEHFVFYLIGYQQKVLLMHLQSGQPESQALHWHYWRLQSCAWKAAYMKTTLKHTGHLEHDQLHRTASTLKRALFSKDLLPSFYKFIFLPQPEALYIHWKDNKIYHLLLIKVWTRIHTAKPNF